MKKIIISTLILSLVACGGSDSSNEVEVVVDPVDVMPIGLWQGSITADGGSYDVVGMIAPSGEARFISADGEQNRFNIKLSGDSYTAEGVGYDINGNFLADIELSGAYTPATLNGTAKVNSVVMSTFTLTIADNSKEGASLSTVSGNYSDVNQSVSIAIDADGVLSGSDIEGCIYTGAVKVPESSVNVYSLAMDISSCAEFDGSYTGLATYTQLFDDSTQKGFIFQIDNGNYLVTEVLIK